MRPAVLGEGRTPFGALRALVLCLLIVSSCFYAASHFIKRIEDQAEENALARAEIGAQIIERMIGQILEESEMYIRLMINSKRIAESGNNIGSILFLEFISDQIYKNEYGFIYAAISNSDGNLIWSSRNNFNNASQFIHYFNGEDTYSITSIILHDDMDAAPHGRPAIQFASRINDDAGRAMGAALVFFDTAQLTRSLTTMHFGPGAAAVIQARDGTLLAHSLPPGTALGAGLPQEHGLARALENAASGRIRIRRSHYDGQPKLAAYRSLAQAPIIVCVALDPRSELAPIAFARPLLLATAAAISMLALTAIALAILWLDRRQAQLALDTARREREAACEQLFHTRRIEALGRLAGGVAHDFNNVLQAVLGGAKSIKRRAADPGIHRLAGMVIDAAERGASVTRRLLTLARRGELRTEPVQLTDVLGGLHEVLTHTLGAEIEVRIEASHPLPAILADRFQLETVLVNLSVNARDAMAPGGGGRLTLSAKAETIAPGEEGDPRPGHYIRIAVEDTGLGMDAATVARATEPFFTTKSNSKGTGLGLAMAKGFIEQSGGALRITSERGQGTTVTLWLPCAEIDARHTLPADTKPAQDAETHQAHVRRLRILLVDDEVLVRNALANDLAALGWNVVTAATGAEALAQLDQAEALDLLVTDLAMPGMDGLALIRAARARRPGLPALLLTGHAGNARADLLDLAEANGPFAVLRKPAHAEAMWASCETLVSQREGSG